jgi:thiamine-monophosphate kinase
MGAEPRAALLSLVLPGSADVADVDAIVGGLLALAGEHGVAIIGGNVTGTPGPMVVDVTAIGSIHPRRVMLRRGARPGDEVYVTGTLGEAAVGLRMLQGGPEGPPLHGPTHTGPAQTGPAHTGPVEADLQVRLPFNACVNRYLRPQPRVGAGLQLGRSRVASSCMDLSDGLADGLRQIAETSGVGITLDAASLPIPDEVKDWHARHGGSAVDTALSGGDDYELLFTVRPAHRGRLRGVRNRLGALPVTRIGVVTRSRALLVQNVGGTRPLPAGFEHFR